MISTYNLHACFAGTNENVAAPPPPEQGALPNDDVVQQTNVYLSLLDPLTCQVDTMFADANRDDPMLFGFPGPIHFPDP